MVAITRDFFVIFLWMQNNLAEGLTCFSCYGITHPRFCDTVTTCQDGEVCALQRYLDPSGYVTFSVGCVVNSICHQKRSDPHPARTCIECCNQDICNHEGCGEHGHGNFSGHYCYSCKGFLENDDCQHITVCNENEACSIHEESRFGERFFTSGCRDKQVCPEIINSHPIVGKRTIPDMCNKCCLSDLCNKDCQKDTKTNYQGPVGTTFYIADLSHSLYTNILLTSMHNGSCDLFRPNGSILYTIPLEDFTGRYTLYPYETIKNEIYELHCNTEIYLFSVENVGSEDTFLAHVVFPGKQCTTLSCLSETRRIFFTSFDANNQTLNSLPLHIMENQTIGDDKYFVIPNIPGKQSIELRLYSTGTCKLYAYDSKLNLISLNHTNNENSVNEVSMKSENITSISTTCLSTLQMLNFSGSYPVGMTVVPGINQYLSHYYFHGFDKKSNGTVSIVISTAHTSKLLLDGSPILSDESKDIQTNFGTNDNYALLTFDVHKGYHDVYTTDDTPFGLWYYYGDKPPIPLGFKIKL